MSESLDIVCVLPDLKETKGFKFIKSFPDVEVYKITARPKEPKLE